jgi:hypothetical protein
LSIEGKVKVIKETEKGRKKVDICWEFSLVNSVIQILWENITKMISVFTLNRSRKKTILKT